MLRRPPTAITLTAEDISAWEHARMQRLLVQQNASSPATQAKQKNATTKVDPNDELRPLPTEKARIVRTRDERIMGTTGGRS